MISKEAALVLGRALEKATHELINEEPAYYKFEAHFIYELANTIVRCPDRAAIGELYLAMPKEFEQAFDYITRQRVQYKAKSYST